MNTGACEVENSHALLQALAMLLKVGIPFDLILDGAEDIRHSLDKVFAFRFIYFRLLPKKVRKARRYTLHQLAHLDCRDHHSYNLDYTLQARDGRALCRCL